MTATDPAPPPADGRHAPPRALIPGTSHLHDERTASLLGVALGVGFAVCFATGLLSHAIQDPPSWFHWPARPAGLYRVTQGAHLVTGFALIPLTLAKLWVVSPRLSQWPPARGAAHALERLMLLPLVGGALFLLVSGVIDVARWYPWSFTFPHTHHWAAWVTVGAMMIHVGVVWATVRRSVGRRARAAGTSVPLVAGQARLPLPAPVARLIGTGDGVASADDRPDPEPADRPDAVPLDAEATDPADPPPGDPPPGDPAAGAGTGATSGERRAFLTAVGAAAGLLALGAGGGTVAWLSPLSAFAQRRPGQGSQGVPVNKSAAGAGVVDAARDPGWRLGVEGAVIRPLTLTLADLRALDQNEATLPIACVEGWAVSARWRGVRLRDIMTAAGAPDGAEITVESLQQGGSYRSSVVEPGVWHDRDTLLALQLNGEPLHLDHGFPLRLIAPNRPGVLQTKWIDRLVIR